MTGKAPLPFRPDRSLKSAIRRNTFYQRAAGASPEEIPGNRALPTKVRGTTHAQQRPGPLSFPLKNSISGRLFKNDEMQGAQILRNEAYNPYAAMTKDEARHSRSRFSTA